MLPSPDAPLPPEESMTDNKKPNDAPVSNQQLTEEETSKVVGGLKARESEQCKETSDSGTTGCPG